ncbi:ribonuclease J [Candidatus Chlorohelix allophototropha]|uniref:Ribonuclease J n=1 Tax=Candidatus Chlorohelix allophototropha TaxID=3003348 RepID=A0ABY9AYX1_9CHLR|nr:ribonuclease J [Chloroflexota bacterium L227-S17]
MDTTDRIKIIPLGGVGEVGKNMTVFEYGDDLIIVDVGLGFPSEEMHGIDLVIPDISYLDDKKEYIRAIILTHGHEDHIGALAFLLPQLGIEIPIYCTTLTAGLVKVKLKERKLIETANLRVISPDDKIIAGSFTIEPYRVAHSVPDGVGLAISTAAGTIVHTGDFKFDQTPVDGRITDFGKIAEFGRRGVLLLMSDCVHVESPGITPSEAAVTQTFDQIFREAEGRIIVATFASLISRVQQVVDVAYRYGRKVVVVGRSLENNVAMGRELGYLDIPENTLIKAGEASKYDPSQLTFVVTGAQGEPMAVLSRIANREHKTLTIQQGDMVIISATPIPGNETAVGNCINNLIRQGADVTYSTIQRVHVSGHASQEELKLMINLVRPRYLMPIHGEPRHLALYSKLAQELGYTVENIFIAENGKVVEVGPNFGGVTGTVPSGAVYIDGSSIGEIGDIVIKDRGLLARDGVLMVVLVADQESGLLVGPADVVSRGFVYVREAGELMDFVKQKVEQRFGDEDLLSDQAGTIRKVKDFVGDLLYMQTKRRPVVLPVVMKI